MPCSDTAMRTSGTVARAAAGKIHSDIERGFIRAEVVAFEDLQALGSELRCKEAGKLRLEGKDYVVLDGDIINFRVNGRFLCEFIVFPLPVLGEYLHQHLRAS